jgi:hypothetical protein
MTLDPLTFVVLPQQTRVGRAMLYEQESSGLANGPSSQPEEFTCQKPSTYPTGSR